MASTPTRTPVVCRLPRWRRAAALSLIFRAEWCSTAQPGRSGRFARTLLGLWGGGILLGCALLTAGLLAGWFP